MEKLNKDLINRLATCEYISEHRNLFITGATGCGKTYMACAFSMEACKQYFNTKYVRLPDLLIDLETAWTDGTMLIAGNKLSDTVIYPFIRMIKKKCKAVDAEKLNLMLWKIYMVSSRKEEFVTAAKKELQPYLTKKDEKQIDTTYDTTYTIDRRH